ncbi:hypothetical protein ABZU32_06250 [Sphaerisporangium sp. NPDC005288]|uniref:hypothetical protein n=1 Tax=Sphaerisporangium sp. NPDC005288 TaxID=3155114 RepID=UPI0033BB61B3
MSTTGLKPFEEVIGRSYGKAAGLADPSAQSPKAQRSTTIRRILHGLVPPAAFAGLGAALAAVFGSAGLLVAIGITIAMFLLQVMASGARFAEVDWDTAAPYWRRTCLELPDAFTSTVQHVVSSTLARRPRITAIHPYLQPCSYGLPISSCGHPECRHAGSVVAGRRRVFVIGAGYVSSPATELEATLRHEMGHAAGIMARYAAMLQTAASVGWMIAGSMHSWIAIGAWWAATAAVGWTNELICDAIALRATSAAACIDGLNATKRATRIPWKHRPLNWLYRLVWYTMPPLPVRIAALRVGALFKPRDRRPVTAGSSQDPRC